MTNTHFAALGDDGICRLRKTALVPSIALNKQRVLPLKTQKPALFIRNGVLRIGPYHPRTGLWVQNFRETIAIHMFYLLSRFSIDIHNEAETLLIADFNEE